MAVFSDRSGRYDELAGFDGGNMGHQVLRSVCEFVDGVFGADGLVRASAHYDAGSLNKSWVDIVRASRVHLPLLEITVEDGDLAVHILACSFNDPGAGNMSKQLVIPIESPDCFDTLKGFIDFRLEQLRDIS